MPYTKKHVFSTGGAPDYIVDLDDVLVAWCPLEKDAVAIAEALNENAQLRQQLAAKQAEVDALMLEYCPSEMSQEQLDNWAAHQRPSEWKTNDELRKQLTELLDWQQKAFAAHPNIDIDIDRLKGGN